MGCQISADATEGIKKVPTDDLQRAPSSPIKIAKVVAAPEARLIQTLPPTTAAKKLQNQNKFEEALEQYEKDFQQDPNNKQLAYSMLRCCKKINSRPSLIKILLKCYKLDQQNLSLCLQLASQYQAAKDLQNSAFFYQKLVELCPQEERHRMKLAAILQNSNKYDEAITEYRKVLELNPQNLAVYRQLISIYKVKQQYSEELKCLEILIKENSHILQQYLQESGQIYVKKLHEYEKSIPYLQKLVELQPDNYLFHQYIGSSYLKSHRIQEAEKSFIKAIEINESDVQSHIGLGNIFLYQEKYHEAIEAFLKAMEYNQNQQHSYIGLGKVYLLLDKVQDSIDCLQKSIQINSKNAEAYLVLAKNYQKQEKKLWCEKWLEKCLAVDDKNVEAALMLANMKFNEQKFDEALEYYNKVIEVDSKNLIAYLRIGQIYQQKESYVFAQKWFRKGIDIDSKSELFFIKLGYQNLFLQSYSEAIIVFNEAVKRNSQRIILTHFLQKRYGQALEEFKKCDLTLGQSVPILLSVALSELNQNKYAESFFMFINIKQLGTQRLKQPQTNKKIWSKIRKAFSSQSQRLLQKLKNNQIQNSDADMLENLKKELEHYSKQENLIDI